MLNPKVIHPKHIHSIQTSLLKNRSAVEEALVTRLYQAAKNLYTNPNATAERGISAVRYNIFDRVLEVSATDDETGLFIKFSGALDTGFDGASLLFGKKFCEEHRDSMRKNITTKIWTK